MTIAQYAALSPRAAVTSVFSVTFDTGLLNLNLLALHVDKQSIQLVTGRRRMGVTIAKRKG